MYSFCDLLLCSAVIMLFVNLICLESKFDFYTSAVFHKDLFSFAIRFAVLTPLFMSKWLIM